MQYPPHYISAAALLLASDFLRKGGKGGEIKPPSGNGQWWDAFHVRRARARRALRGTAVTAVLRRRR